ncbi:MAG: PepSY-associated TM helix domain-containing protein [Bacteroidota bacterium]
MKLNRKLFFRIHSWIGIKLSILFFIVCFSGTLATLSSEMDWLFIPEIRAKVQDSYASRNEIVKKIKEKYPKGKIEYWSSFEVPYLCNQVYVNVEGQRFYVFVNPYTGEVQGASSLTFRRFFRDLHYFLFIPLQIGHFTVLIFAFLLFISLTTALLFYKKWHKKLFDLKFGKGWVVFFRSAHRLVGLWSIPFTILFSITGIWYFLERTNTANVSKIANTRAPKLELPLSDSAFFERITYEIDYDRAALVAETEIPYLRVKDISPPAKMDQPIYLTGLSKEPLVRHRANRVYLHPTTYEVLKVQKAKETATVTWLNDIADPLHFGYWGGLITKIIWFFGGLSISGLVLTGIWISLKRKVKDRQRRKAQRLGAWKYVNGFFGVLILICMYAFLVLRYAASLPIILLITGGWGFLAVLAWYVFDYRIKKAVEKELALSK